MLEFAIHHQSMDGYDQSINPHDCLTMHQTGIESLQKEMGKVKKPKKKKRKGCVCGAFGV